MGIDYQSAFNIAFVIAGFLCGWVLNGLRDSLKSLQSADAELTQKVQAIEVLVAGKYITRTDFEATVTAMFSKLDKIYDRLEAKADK
jgi:hypothetical protein